MKNKVMHYMKQDDGATAIEYALIASGISIAIAVTVVLTGDAVLGMFNTVIGLF